jgi:hypothetical protein
VAKQGCNSVAIFKAFSKLCLQFTIIGRSKGLFFDKPSQPLVLLTWVESFEKALILLITAKMSLK